MNGKGKILIALLAFMSLASFRHLQQGGEWVYEREKQGIKIFTKKSKWGKLRDSKAVMTVSASPDQMLKLLTNIDNYKTWLTRCKRSRVVARLNENEFIMQLVFSAPWPLKDRDCVVRVKIDKDPQTGVIIFTETSEPKYLSEEADVVRIQQLVSTWKLIPKEGGTEVINEYSSNPGAGIPDWLTNTQSVETPLSTFEHLQEKTSTKK